jgi:hypothetical protein
LNEDAGLKRQELAHRVLRLIDQADNFQTLREIVVAHEAAAQKLP